MFRISECLSTPEIASKSGQSHGDYLSACFAQLNSASCVIECLNKVSLYEQLDVSTFSQVLQTVERFLLKREEQTEALDLDFPGSEDVLKRSSKMKSEPLVILRQLFERLSKTNKLYHSIWQLYEAQGIFFDYIINHPYTMYQLFRYFRSLYAIFAWSISRRTTRLFFLKKSSINR